LKRFSFVSGGPKSTLHAEGYQPDVLNQYNTAGATKKSPDQQNPAAFAFYTRFHEPMARICNSCHTVEPKCGE